MNRLRPLFCLLLVVLTVSCKKDVLHTDKVYRLVSNTTDRMNRMIFINDKTCLVAGGEKYDRATILRSDNGGYTWTAGSYPLAGKAFYGLGIAPSGHIYMSGVDGVVLHSGDSGQSWQLGRIPDWEQYVGISFPTSDTGVFVSTTLQRMGAIVQVDTNFNIISKDTFLHGINDVYMVSPSTGYVIGYGAVLKTTDFRRTWVYQDVKGDNFTAMDVHGDEIWMCGANGSVFHTDNGGAAWQRLRNGNSLALKHFSLRDILFIDNTHGWAVGDDGLVIYSQDGGSNWMEFDRFTTSTLRAIVKCPNGDMLIAGDGGELYRFVL